MKIVINDCFGGFGLSKEAITKLYKAAPELCRLSDASGWLGSLRNVRPTTDGGNKIIFLEDEDSVEFRSHPAVIKIVEEMGERANGECAKLKVINIPDGVAVEIDEYDGSESVHEVHRSWS